MQKHTKELSGHLMRLCCSDPDKSLFVSQPTHLRREQKTAELRLIHSLSGKNNYLWHDKAVSVRVLALMFVLILECATAHGL